MEQKVVLNKQLKVLGPNGWVDFSGVRRSIVKGLYNLTLSNNENLSCTKDHLISTNFGLVEAEFIKPNDVILTANGPSKVVSKTYDPDAEEYVYDLLDVEGGNLYYTNNIISHNCEFQGSSSTLVSGNTLKLLSHSIPIHTHDSLNVYEEKRGNNQYMMICDVSRGKGLDYSAFHVIDITSMPYKQVATYRSNLVTPLDYASIIYRTAKAYNTAAVIVEINDIGGQVVDSLFHDFEYENIIYTESAGARGKRIATGFGKSGVERGIRTSKTVKAIGCSMLKLLIEQNQLIINDHQTIYELSRFSKKGSSYEAEAGCNDDLVAGLFLFAWATDQQYFKEISDINTLDNLRDLSEEQIESSLAPLGIFDDGVGFSDDVIDLTNGFHPEFQFF